jgi:hypothetical protein
MPWWGKLQLASRHKANRQPAFVEQLGKLRPIVNRLSIGHCGPICLQNEHPI